MEERTAWKWYWSLWLSPLLTVPTLCVLAFPVWWSGEVDTRARVVYSRFVLYSSLWHLILLVPALTGKSEFVRWHGWQALLLAGVRTVVPLGFVLAFGIDSALTLLAVPILLVIYLLGTLWSHEQAERGKCTLMRWFGLADEQPAVLRAQEVAQDAEGE